MTRYRWHTRARSGVVMARSARDAAERAQVTGPVTIWRLDYNGLEIGNGKAFEVYSYTDPNMITPRYRAEVAR
jgi:hypothetical protein